MPGNPQRGEPSNFAGGGVESSGSPSPGERTRQLCYESGIRDSGDLRDPRKGEPCNSLLEDRVRDSPGLRSRANPARHCSAGGVGDESLREWRGRVAGSPEPSAPRPSASTAASLSTSGPAWRRPGPRAFFQKVRGRTLVPGLLHSPARPSRAVSPRSGCTSCTGSPATCRSACGP